jgi:hypothetical protein
MSMTTHFQGGGGQRKIQPPKTSGYTHFQVVWVVVVARGRPNTENKQLRSFSGVMGGGGGQKKVQCPKTSVTARFWGGCGQRIVQHPKTSTSARFRGDGGKRKAQPPKMSSHTHFLCVWVVVVARGRPNH